MRRLEIVAAARASAHEQRVGSPVTPFRLRFRIRRDRRTVAVLLCVALGVVIGGTAAVWVFPEQAFATSCINETYHFNVEPSTPNDHHGTGVFNPGMYIEGITPVCVHVSSVSSLNPTAPTDEVEIGWIDIAKGLPYNKDFCSIVGTGSPELFRTWTRAGNWYCNVFNDTLTPWTWDTMGIEDANGDDTWNSSFNGNGIGQGLSEDFSLSITVSNGKRFGQNESAAATFKGLVYMPLNGGWTSWGAADCFYDNDPTYNNYIHSANWVDVSTATTCGQ